MNSLSYRFLSLIILSLLLTGPIFADDIQDAKDRMRDRLAQIDQMKSDGSVGENANGYLSIRGSLGPRQSSLVEAENTDRRVIYQSVARESRQSVQEVGRQRALRLIQMSRSGVWVQKPDGEWIRKP